MIDEKKLIERLQRCVDTSDNSNFTNGLLSAIDIVNQQPKIGEWIPCSQRMPENETEVEITFVRKRYKTGEAMYLTARAFYEDVTLTTEESIYGWNETDNWEYDEELDSYIIPEGWFECVSFSEELGIVDMPVIAWRHLSEPYQPQIS